MSFPAKFVKDLEAFPRVLRDLLAAELAAGNKITEIGHSFPAPPAGAYVKLAKPIATRPRESGDGIEFYDRNTSLYSGEITDEKRFYFLLEPPHPPPPEEDMDAIRARPRSKQGRPESAAAQRRASEPERAAGIARATPPNPTRAVSIVERFQASMEMNYEKWHDGIGYDLDLIRNGSPEEIKQLERFLTTRPVSDWRDVEALAALGTPAARALLRQTLQSGDPELRIAVADYAPKILSEDEHTASLVAALESAEAYAGLAQTLLQVEEFHPPKVREALLRGVLARDGETAVHFAAMLMFIYGKASSAFDWEQRPFFLKFLTESPEERAAMFVELCRKIGVDPAPYFAEKVHRRKHHSHREA